MTKSGYVTVMGRPNVGKSTLINALLTQKLAAVSAKPQTTRKNQLGILTQEEYQIIFQDTPGLHKAHHKLGEYMNEQAMTALEDANVILFVVDVCNPPQSEDEQLAELLSAEQRAIILVLNKMDLLGKSRAKEEPYFPLYQDLLPKAEPMLVSALDGESIERLLIAILSRLPEHPFYYPEDQVTDWYEREIAADLIREAALNHLRDEVPHCLAVQIDEYTERGGNGAYIAASLYVERDSQKGILIGQGGDMLKKIGSSARKEIEKMSGRKIFLELRAKTRAHWRNNEKALRSFGYRKSN